jgi:hypothetical protein
MQPHAWLHLLIPILSHNEAFGDNILGSCLHFPEYVKLVKMAMVQIVGSVEDEHYFYMLAFMKSKFCNKLTTHLPLVVWMFAQ